VEGENSTSGPQPYQPYEGGDYPLPYFQHSPMGIRASVDQNSDLQAPLSEASKLPRLLHGAVPYGADQAPPFTYQGAPFALIQRPIHRCVNFYIPFALIRGLSTVSRWLYFYIPFVPARDHSRSAS